MDIFQALNTPRQRRKGPGQGRPQWECNANEMRMKMTGKYPLNYSN